MQNLELKMKSCHPERSRRALLFWRFDYAHRDTQLSNE
jgi:hypothetical protein